MILDEIVIHKRRELERAKQRLPLERVREQALARPLPRDIKPALRGKTVQVIAEVKKASPSRGVIRQGFNPIEIARRYAKNGAAAISVLTEEAYFQGSLDYLQAIKIDLGETCPPLLRKDFILDAYQVYESRANGADALLLIAATLDAEKLQELLELSHSLHLNCLVEVHNEAEVARAVRSGAAIIGINNRDLKTFTVDITTTGRLRELIPPDRIVVSESGVRNRQDMERLKNWEVDAALVGETLMKADDSGTALRELLRCE